MAIDRERLERLHGQLRHDLGPEICAALADAIVTDIKVGDDGKVFIRRHVLGWQDTKIMLPIEQRLRALNTMASLLGKALTERSSLLSGELPLTGDRLEAAVPPAAKAPGFVIRRHAPEIYTLEDYVRKGIMTPYQADMLLWHMRHRSNLVFSGALYSGKTTLLNACLQKVESLDHILIVEDTYELQCHAPNVTWRKAEKKPQKNEPAMWDQLNASLRLSPNRLIVGETRDGAAHEMLKIWNTGTRGGMTTVHAESARGVFWRFADLCEEAGVKEPPWRLMRAAIDLIVHIELRPEGRRVTEMVEVLSEKGGAIPIALKQLWPPGAEPLTTNGKGVQHV